MGIRGSINHTEVFTHHTTKLFYESWWSHLKIKPLWSAALEMEKKTRGPWQMKCTNLSLFFSALEVFFYNWVYAQIAILRKCCKRSACCDTFSSSISVNQSVFPLFSPRTDRSSESSASHLSRALAVLFTNAFHSQKILWRIGIKLPCQTPANEMNASGRDLHWLQVTDASSGRGLSICKPVCLQHLLPVISWGKKRVLML